MGCRCRVVGITAFIALEIGCYVASSGSDGSESREDSSPSRGGREWVVTEIQQKDIQRSTRKLSSEVLVALEGRPYACELGIQPPQNEEAHYTLKELTPGALPDGKPLAPLPPCRRRDRFEGFTLRKWGADARD